MAYEIKPATAQAEAAAKARMYLSVFSAQTSICCPDQWGNGRYARHCGASRVDRAQRHHAQRRTHFHCGLPLSSILEAFHAQTEAVAQARMYLSLFERAGIEMSLGPMGEPGTSGGLPGPAGVFMFQSPAPGVITYEYRRGRLVPVPVPQPEPATARRWRWKLQPLTPMQKQAIVTTTVGGAMLMIIMIILAPVGA